MSNSCKFRQRLVTGIFLVAFWGFSPLLADGFPDSAGTAPAAVTFLSSGESGSVTDKPLFGATCRSQSCRFWLADPALMHRPGLEYLWEFGDGYSSDTATPAHRYSTLGSYTASLRIRDAFGNDYEASGTIPLQFDAEIDLSANAAELQSPASNGVGSRVAGLGSFAGNAVSDFAISSFGTQSSNSPAVFVVLGSDGQGLPENLDDLDGTDGFMVTDVPGELASGSFGSAIGGGADLSGNAHSELLIGDRQGTDVPGTTWVVYGQPGPFPELLDLSSPAGLETTLISGAQANDWFGHSVASAGNFSGAGDSIIVGAPLTDIIFDGPFTSGVGGQLNAGAAYLIQGSGDGPLPDFSVGQLTPDQGFPILSNTAGLRAGMSVDGIGDFNGSGLDDVLVGRVRTFNDPEPETPIGWVIYGMPQPFPEFLLLDDLDGQQGFAIVPEEVDAEPFTLESRDGLVAGMGDVNGNGLDDFGIIDQVIPEEGPRVARAYVVFGAPEFSGAEINLGDLDGSNGFRITGLEEESASAAPRISRAGDISGNGIDDILVGDPSRHLAWVIFGSADGFPATIDVNQLDGSNGFQISSTSPASGLGRSLAALGDVSGDGQDQMLLGTTGVNAGSGAGWVMFDEGSPEIEVSPESLDFLVQVGGQETQVLTIGNTGGAPLDWELSVTAPDSDETDLQGADLDETLSVPDFELFPGQPVEFTVPGGVTSQAPVTGIAFEGTVVGIEDTGFWASDTRMDVTSPEGEEFSVGGFDNPGEYTWGFDGAASGFDGFYTSAHPDVFGPGGILDEGDWDLSFVLDFSKSPERGEGSFEWTDVSITLLKEFLIFTCDQLGEFPWLTINTIAGTVEPGDSQGVDVAVDASELDPGIYEAQACIYSNDPLEPLPIIVPIILEVFEDPIPVIDPIDDQAVIAGDTLEVEFSISDPEFAPESLLTFAFASDPEILPDDNLEILGEGGIRTLVIETLPDLAGLTEVNVEVVNPLDQSDSTTFVLDIAEPPDPPVPSIAPIPNQTAVAGSSLSVGVTISDPEFAPEQLALTASSGNTAILPDSALLLAGTGANRTLSINTLDGFTGTVPVTVEVTNPLEESDSTTFTLVITEPPRPEINDGEPLPDVNVIAGESASVDFQVTDPAEPADNLVMTATSSNQDLIPDDAISITGTGENRSVTFQTLPGVFGQSEITIEVTNSSGQTATTSFMVTVSLPATTLELDGQQVPISGLEDSLMRLTTSNLGSHAATGVQLMATVSEPFQAIGVFTGLGDCAVVDGVVSCPTGQAPDWQCSVFEDTVSCLLESLAPGDEASLVIRIQGSGQALLPANVEAINASPVTVEVDLVAE